MKHWRGGDSETKSDFIPDTVISAPESSTADDLSFKLRLSFT